MWKYGWLCGNTADFFRNMMCSNEHHNQNHPCHWYRRSDDATCAKKGKLRSGKSGSGKSGSAIIDAAVPVLSSSSILVGSFSGAAACQWVCVPIKSHQNEDDQSEKQQCIYSESKATLSAESRSSSTFNEASSDICPRYVSHLL